MSLHTPSTDLHPETGSLSSPGCVAVIGAGGFGRFCIETYRQAGDVRVIAVCDPRFAGETLEEDSSLRVQANWHTAIDHPDIEVVHLATPPYLRGEIICAALQAGKSVFCEKPLALSQAEAETMIATAVATGCTIGVDYVLRHHPAFHLLYQLAETGLFGHVHAISLQNFAQALPSDHWMWDERKSGGILVEHGVHFFDAYGRLAGDARSIQASTPRPHAVQATVAYAHGAAGTFYHDFSYPPSLERAQGIVFFERGYIEIDGWIPQRLRGEVVSDAEAFDLARTSLDLEVDAEHEDIIGFHHNFGDRQLAYRTAIVAGMRETVTRHRDPSFHMKVSAQDALASLSLSLAGQRSVQTGYSEWIA